MCIQSLIVLFVNYYLSYMKMECVKYTGLVPLSLNFALSDAIM
jgi:hypothetical protein